MRRELWLACLLLPLNGCYVPPPNASYGYAQPGYPPDAYPPGSYPQPSYPPAAYAPTPYQPYAGDPGYSYNDGAPVIVEGGASVPLVFFGGSWGYYDSQRQWHRAPEGVSRDLESRRAGDGHFQPNSAPRPGYNQQQARPAATGYGGQSNYHPAEQPRPAATPYAAPRPAQAAPQRQEEERTRGRECPAGQRC